MSRIICCIIGLSGSSVTSSQGNIIRGLFISRGSISLIYSRIFSFFSNQAVISSISCKTWSTRTLYLSTSVRAAPIFCSYTCKLEIKSSFILLISGFLRFYSSIRSKSTCLLSSSAQLAASSASFNRSSTVLKASSCSCEISRLRQINDQLLVQFSFITLSLVSSSLQSSSNLCNVNSSINFFYGYPSSVFYEGCSEFSDLVCEYERSSTSRIYLRYLSISINFAYFMRYSAFSLKAFSPGSFF